MRTVRFRWCNTWKDKLAGADRDEKMSSLKVAIFPPKKMTVPTGSQVVGGFCSHQPGKGFFVYKCCYLLKEDPLKR